MSTIFVTNLVTDPRVASDADPTYSLTWNYGFGDDAGGGGGSNATRYTTGSPFADCTTYAGGALKGGTGLPGATVMNTVIAAPYTPVTAGSTYSIRIEGAVDQTATGMTAEVTLLFTNADKSQLVQLATIPQASPVANQASTYIVQVVVPQGAAMLQVGYQISVPVGTTLTGNIYATGAMIIPQDASDAPYSGPYWDGSTAAGGTATYTWLGSVNASPSRMTITLPDPPAPKQAPTIVPVATFRQFKPLQVSDWTVQEDGTPIDPSDTTGGVGQITLTAPENDDTKYLRQVPIDFSVPSQGVTRGTIADGGATDGVAQIVANSRLNALTVIRTATAFTGTFEDGLLYYLGLVGITTGIVIDDVLKPISVDWPGWHGAPWDQIKKVCTAYGCEISLVSNNVVIRQLRQRIAQNYRDASVGWAMSDQQIAQTVEGYYFTKSHSMSGLIFPAGGWTKDTPIIDGLAAGSVTTQTINLMPDDGSEGAWASPIAIQQPVCVDSVAPDYAASSVYAVSGNDNLPYTAAQWNAMGGSITAKIGDDQRSIVLTITAPNDTKYAPFSISMVSGPSNSYASLRIVGEAIVGKKTKMTLSTGRSADDAPQVVGATVENEFMDSRQALRTALLWTASRYSGTQTLQVTTKGINRLGDTGSYRYPLISEWDAEYSGKTLADINTQYASKTLGDIDQDQFASVQFDFSNQAFGNIGGARVMHDDTWYRIRSDTNTSTGIQYSAERDNTIGDLDDAWAGKTLGDIDSLWSTFRLMDMNARLMRTE